MIRLWPNVIEMKKESMTSQFLVRVIKLMWQSIYQDSGRNDEFRCGHP